MKAQLLRGTREFYQSLRGQLCCQDKIFITPKGPLHLELSCHLLVDYEVSIVGVWTARDVDSSETTQARNSFRWT